MIMHSSITQLYNESQNKSILNTRELTEIRQGNSMSRQVAAVRTSPLHTTTSSSTVIRTQWKEVYSKSSYPDCSNPTETWLMFSNNKSRGASL